MATKPLAALAAGPGRVADCRRNESVRKQGSDMVSKRLSREAGHRRKFLAIIDDTPECERAVAYAVAARQEHQRRAGAALCHRAGRFPALAGRREDHARRGDRRRRDAALDGYADQGAREARHRAGTGGARRQADRGDPQADRGRPGHRHPGAGRRRRQGRPGTAGRRRWPARARPSRFRSRSCRRTCPTRRSTASPERPGSFAAIAAPFRCVSLECAADRGLFL